jgi:multicomponent Na+:H+ antiporter subunit F
MDTFLLVLAGFLALLLLLPFYRVLRGPTVFDRLLGAGIAGSKTIVIVCLFGLIYGRIDMFIDIALGYGILNFVGAVAIEKYYGSRETHP